MLMTLGPFVFMLQSIPFQQARRQRQWRYAELPRMGARDATQYTGPGPDKLELSGVLMPEITGGPATLDLLAAMAAQARAWPLVEGTGSILGTYVIEEISQTASHTHADGAPQRLEFGIKLHRVDTWGPLASAAAAIGGGLLGSVLSGAIR